MRNLILILSLIVAFEGNAQNNSTCESLLEILETDIVFNEYLTDEVRIEKINQLIETANKKDFDKKKIFLMYAQVNLTFTKNKDYNDQALYQFVELSENCDTLDQTELRIYLGSLLQISSVLRESSAFELSYEYVKKGIKIIERENLKNYPWIQDFYNDAGVDLLSMGDYQKSNFFLNKALNNEKEIDFLQDAMIEYNLSFLNYELNNIDSAIYHQEITRSFLEQIIDLSSYPDLYVRYGNSMGSLAIFYYSNNNLVKAKSTALKAKEIFKTIDIYDALRYPHLYTLINLAIDNNEEEQIQELLIEIKFTADKVEKGKFHFHKLLSDSYSRIKNTTQENNYLSLAYIQAQKENSYIVNELQKFNSKLQSQILQREKIKFQEEKEEYNRKASLITSIISLIFLSLITILYILYIRTRNKKNLLVKEKEISKIEHEKNEMKSKLTESELNEKRLVTNRLASHIKLKQQTESAFLQKIKELKQKKPQNIEAEISSLHIKMMNLINIDQNLEQHLQVNDINQESKVKLKQIHPDLSEKELQFCSYLLLNLTTKEIGSITNQSDGAIRVYKNRLKNKLVGKQEIDLANYLLNI